MQNILNRKAHFWKPKYSQAVPHYMQPKLRDPFDYPLRSKQEVFASLQHYQILARVDYYPDLQGLRSDYNRKIQLMVDLDQMKLSKKQKERMVFLLGPRYKGDDILKITVQNSTDYAANIERGKEMIHELYLEALRAP